LTDLSAPCAAKGAGSPRRLRTVLVAAGICAVALTTTVAQRRYGAGLPSAAAKPFGSNGRYDGRFRFARLSYDCMSPPGYRGCWYYRNEPSWEHGYPLSEQNLMQIMDAVSSLHPHVEDSEVLAMDDPELLKYPVSYMTEASFWITNDKEAAALGAYLKKGGFLIADDFRDDFYRGSGGWANFDANIQRAIPGARFIDLTPDDPIFHSFFEINSFDAIPQDYDTGRPIFRGLYEDNDPKKRMLIMANFNTDVSNWWEYSGQGYHLVSESNEAYKLGVNYIVYGLTH
jgi:hypothetical protein